MQERLERGIKMKKILLYILAIAFIHSSTIAGSLAEEQVDLDFRDYKEETSIVSLKNEYKVLKNEITDIDYSKSPEKDFQDAIAYDRLDNYKSSFEINEHQEKYNNQAFDQVEYLEFYEVEPNNNIVNANLLGDNFSGEYGYRVFGTITDYYFDMDYYRIDVAAYGTFNILSYWVGDYYGFGWEDDLVFSLKDSKGDTIIWSSTIGIGTSMAQQLVAQVSPGTYYLSVMQISDYQYLYIGEWYTLDILFEPSSIPVSGINLNKTTLTLNLEESQNNETLVATVLPANATDKTLHWKSSNTNIATVTGNGVVTPVATGLSVITATTNDGNYKASCVVSVIDSSEGWEIWEAQYDVIPNKTWTIDFNKTLDIETIKQKNIYITDKEGAILPMFYYQLSRDIDKKIFIMPIKEYKLGQSYTLWIKDLKASDGSVLRKKVKMDFTIQ